MSSSSYQTQINYELARLYVSLSEAKEKYQSASTQKERQNYADIIRDLESVILDAENTKYGR